MDSSLSIEFLALYLNLNNSLSQGLPNSTRYALNNVSILICKKGIRSLVHILIKKACKVPSNLPLFPAGPP